MLSIEELSWIALSSIFFAVMIGLMIGALLDRLAKLESRVAELEKRA